MCHLVFAGTELPRPDVLGHLFAHGYTITLTHGDISFDPQSQQAPRLLIVALSDAQTMPLAAYASVGTPWIGWNRTNNPLCARQAYEAGALAVLPGDVPAQTLLRAVRTAIEGAQTPRRAQVHMPNVRRRHYQPGERLVFDDDVLIEIQRGVVVQTALHSDGNEVLLAIVNAGETLIQRNQEQAIVQITAQTPVDVAVQTFHAARNDAATLGRIWQRMFHMQNWAAIQAHPHLEERIIGMLRLLAAQFGVRHGHGTLVDVRITHTQLAAATGVSRTTITRAAKQLRARGLICTVGRGEGERFWLRDAEELDLADQALEVNRFALTLV